MYDENDTPWHACGWSHTTVGVAVYGDFHTGDHAKHRVVTPEQWSSLVYICRDIVKRHGPVFILGHTELAGATKIPGKVCPGANLDLWKLTQAAYA